MKAFLFSFISVSVILACNNNKTTEVAGSASLAAATPSADAKPVSGGSGCSSFLWFKEGTTLQYNMADANGKSIAVTTTHITNVKSDAQGMVADFTTSYNNSREVKGTYRCSGDKLYMDTRSFFENNFASLKKAGVDIEIANSDISFPWNMKTGDNLEDANFSANVKKDGKQFMKMTIIIKDRKVEGVEKVTTPAGTWDCLKLSQVQTSNTEMMGRSVNGQNTKAIQWFSTNGGLVKYETYDDKGKLQSSSELISIK